MRRKKKGGNPDRNSQLAGNPKYNGTMKRKQKNGRVGRKKKDRKSAWAIYQREKRIKQETYYV